MKGYIFKLKGWSLLDDSKLATPSCVGGFTLMYWAWDVLFMRLVLCVMPSWPHVVMALLRVICWVVVGWLYFLVLLYVTCYVIVGKSYSYALLSCLGCALHAIRLMRYAKFATCGHGFASSHLLSGGWLVVLSCVPLCHLLRNSWQVISLCTLFLCVPLCSRLHVL